MEHKRRKIPECLSYSATFFHIIKVNGDQGMTSYKRTKKKKTPNIIIKVVHATRALYSKSSEVIALCEENRHLI